MATSSNDANTNANVGDDSKKKGFSGFKMPNVDANAFMDSCKKNMELFSIMNKMSMEVCGGIAKLNAAFMKQMMADMGEAMSGKPSEAMSRFSDFARNSTVKAVVNNKQISDIITAASNDITATVTKRVRDSIQETKHAMGKK